MVKAEIFKNIAKRADISPEVVETVLAAYTGFVMDTLRDNKSEKVVLPGMGTFSARHVDAKTGVVNLGASKGSTWTKPAHDEMVFKFSGSAKELT